MRVQARSAIGGGLCALLAFWVVWSICIPTHRWLLRQVGWLATGLWRVATACGRRGIADRRAWKPMLEKSMKSC